LAGYKFRRKRMKIFELEELSRIIAKLKSKKKKIVLCHGCFDLLHPGHIKHLHEAKEMGDVLVVTVTPDIYVDKGEGRPAFAQNIRIEAMASLECVDYVAINKYPTACETLRLLRPDVYVKGGEFEGKRDRKLQEEQEVLVEIGGEMRYTHSEVVFSSTKLLNQYFQDVYPEETRRFLEDFSSKYSFEYIKERLGSIKDLKVLLIGDGIIDEYHYCESMGKSPKAQIIVHKYISHEVFVGGSFAIANHLAGLCNIVHLATLLGKEDSKEDFVLKNLKPNIETKFFYRECGPTIVKRRYINQYQNQKVFEVNYINNQYIKDECEKEILNYLKRKIPEYDLILVADFGHGFITDKIIKTIEGLSKKIAVNAQVNGANAGYNLITKYKSPNFICLDLPEARLATQDRFSPIEDIARKLSKSLKSDYIIITEGKHGSTGIDRNGKVDRTFAFSIKVVDITGAGDAFFAYAAPCFALDLPLDLVSFIGNAVGALAVQILGNKRSIEKCELLEFIHTILKK
jgi:rfaE bifunctional protein kinase chain/domain/rfaE bifunctional protein nucleotidyltransferase chain/domain